MPAMADDDIPVVDSFGRSHAKVGVAQASTFSDRGGAIAIPRSDPHAKRAGAAE
jgi:hypothetical protein